MGSEVRANQPSMSDRPTRLQRKGLIGRVGELLVDGHADCLEELGAFVIADSRINEFFAGLKQRTATMKAGKSLKQLDDEYRQVYETLGRAFERASAEFLSAESPNAEWPKSRLEGWEENRVKLLQAVTALTEQVTRLLAEYVP